MWMLVFFRFESVTIPENQEVNFGDVEPSIDYSNRYTSSATFQRTAYVAMVNSRTTLVAETFCD